MGILSGQVASIQADLKLKYWWTILGHSSARPKVVVYLHQLSPAQADETDMASKVTKRLPHQSPPTAALY